MDYNNILTALNNAASFEDFSFTIDGVDCFVARDIYPKTVFSMGVKGRSTAMYKKGTLHGVLNSFGVGQFDGDSPTPEQVARQIMDCYNRQQYLASIVV